ncbi:MAG: O-antigen ligase family protein [Cycloclasticus sp.]|jgi:O-Antigen ligase.
MYAAEKEIQESIVNEKNVNKISALRYRSNARLVSLVFALMICGYPFFSFIPDLLGLNGRTGSIIFRCLCLCLAFIMLSRQVLLYKKMNAWLIFGCLFWLLYFVRVVLEYGSGQINAPMSFFDFFAYAFGISFVCFLIFPVVRDLDFYRYAPLYVQLFTLITCFIATYIVFFIEGTAGGRLFANERLNPITLGHTGVLLSLTSIWILLQSGKEKVRITYSLLCFFSIAIGVIALGLSASRSPVIALIVCSFIMFRGARLNLYHYAALGLGLLIVIFVFDFSKILTDHGTALSRVFNFSLSVYDTQEGGRVSLYTEALHQFSESPVFGQSLFLENGHYPHNVIIDALMSTGIVGFFILIVLIFVSFWNLYLLSKRYELGKWLFVLYVQAFVGSMTSGAIFYDPMFWSTLGVGLGLVGRSRLIKVNEVG